MQVGPGKMCFFLNPLQPTAAPLSLQEISKVLNTNAIVQALLAGHFFKKTLEINSRRGRGVKILKVLGKNTIFLTPYG